MNKLKKLSISLKGFTNALYRFPLTGLFLLIATILNHLELSGGRGDYSSYIMTLGIGAIITAVGQVIYERGYKLTNNRILIHVFAILLTFLYYYSIARHSDFNMINSVRTIIILLILVLLFIWIPVAKSSLTFNESIIITFKSLFITIFFALIIFLGAILINFAIDSLLFSTSYRFAGYAANIIFLLYAPIYFLSLIPIYPRVYNNIADNEEDDINKERIENIVRRAHSDKYLVVLFSYIIIPITGIFTVILLLYIIKNIGSSFWTDNLLEPMMVSYSITVILVYLLTSLFDNRITVLFRKIFPKVLIPIVLLQTVASFMKIGDMGITHNRYFVILYGIFAIIAGLVFSILPVKKNGIIAPILILMSVISITPPIDAFSISISNQSNMLREALDRNNMMENNKVVPNSNISKEDKEIIIQAINYLREVDYKENLREVIKDSYGYTDFNKTFGFDYGYNDTSIYYNFNLLAGEFIDISNYDIFVTTYMQSGIATDSSIKIGDFDYNGIIYTLRKIDDNGQGSFVLFDNRMEEIIRISNDDIINHFLSYNEEYKELTQEEAKVSKENDKARITIVVQNLYFRGDVSGIVDKDYKDGSIYLLIDFK